MKHLKHRFINIATGGLVALGLLALAGCNRKPDLALCGNYYRHLLQLQQAGHQGVLAAMKTTQGKDAVVDYCMSLQKKRVECVLESGDVGAAVTCESGAESSFIDDIMSKF